MRDACRFAISWAACAIVSTVTLAAEPDGEFRDVLTTAGLGPDVLGPLAAKSEFDADDWHTISQLVYRLDQFSAEQLRQWASDAGQGSGDLVRLSTTVTGNERLPIPDGIGTDSPMPRLYRCQFGAAGQEGRLLVPQLPKRWEGRKLAAEPVKLWGVVLGTTRRREQLVVTNHLAWYPEADLPSGWLLLSRNGMDVSLLDEIRHRQPFVRPEVSREGEAFYAALAAMSQADRQELAKLTLENVAGVAARFQAMGPALRDEVTELRRRIAAEQDPAQRELLGQQLTDTRRELALVEAVAREGTKGLSSVAPMFLEPESQVGELVRIEGVARRAVRIAVPESGDRPPGLDAYYEVDVFTPDSQNLPVVCCVARLPAEFPLGDVIREPVQLDGVFFKCWRYGSRKNLAETGETGRAAALYTPVVVGGDLRQLPTVGTVGSGWGLWGGIAFLAALAAIWIVMLRTAAQDHRRRAASSPANLDNIFEGP